MKWHEILPVLISIAVIILVAVLQKQSKLVAAVTATMPLTIPLSLWVVYSSSKGERESVETFARSLISGIVPTLFFTMTIWITARLGWKLIPMLAAGYTIWGLTLLAMIWLQNSLGF